MRKGCIIWAVAGIIILFVFISIRGSYNEMVQMDEEVQAQWGQVKTVYQRRFDLIGNLVETVKGYADFEKGTLENIVTARSRVGQINLQGDDLDDPEKIKAFEQAQQQLSGSLGRLMVVMENYPNLKAGEQFSTLMLELERSENRISIERKKFNEKVQVYNSHIRKFPKNIYAGLFGFEKKAYFEGDAANEQAPKVDFQKR